MKRISALIFLGFISLASAKSPDRSCHPGNGEHYIGAFAYNGGIEVIGAQAVAIVDDRTTNGQKDLQRLRGSGYTCQRVVANTHRCEKHLKNALLPKALRDQIDRRYEGTNVTFAKEIGEVKQVHDSAAYKEWKVVQTVKDATGKYDKYHFRDMGTLQKIVLGDSESASEYLAVSCERLGQVILTASGVEETQGGGTREGVSYLLMLQLDHNHDALQEE